MHIVSLSIVLQKHLSLFINISLTLHYCPIIQPKCTAFFCLCILVSFFFLFLLLYCSLHTHLISPLNCSSWVSVIKKICLHQCPLQSSEIPAVSFVVPLRLLYFFLFISSSARGTHGTVTHYVVAMTFYIDSRFLDIRKGTHHRSAHSHQAHPRSRSLHRTATAWRCTCS